LSAQDVIRLLDLRPHPEGGHFRETFRDRRTIDGGRAASTAIYFLLARGERARWHRVDAVETWHWYAGSLGDWTLAGCTVAPGFEFAGFELAPAGRSPP
jgi:predicted cupin superfamily sugar epimerase